jgi:uncharacterized lipoprotein YmbA
MRPRTLVALASALVISTALSGCVLGRSKEARIFVLDPLAAREAGKPSDSPEAVVGVLRVTVPGWIDRPQVTGRSAAGEITASEFAIWGEPIGRGIQRVLAENLAALLPNRRVVSAPFPPSHAVNHRLDLTLVEAGRQTDGSVQVDARWAILDEKGETLVQRRTSHDSRPTAAGAAGAVAGVDEALLALSREIAEVLRALPVLQPKTEQAVPADTARN